MDTAKSKRRGSPRLPLSIVVDSFPWQTAIRAVLKIGGGFFVSKAFHDDSWLEGLSAVGAAAVGIAWGMAKEQRVKKRIALMEEAAQFEPSI